MAKKASRQKQTEKKIAFILAGVLITAVLAAIMLASPAFALWIKEFFGIADTASPPSLPQNLQTAVHVIDVGQGNASLLYSAGEYALIDAGTPESSGILQSYLRKAGVQSLRYVFMSHPHADHIGGMAEILENFNVQEMIFPNFELAPYPTSSIFVDVLRVLEERQIPTKTALLGQEYPLGSGQIQVVHGGIETQDNYNLLSLGLLFKANGIRFLATGDGEKENEAAMLESAIDFTANCFVAGHHGSYTSNTKDFIAAVAPQYVAISCAAGNSYGHPHAQPLKTFEQMQVHLLRTDKNSNIVFWPDEDGKICYAVGKM